MAQGAPQSLDEILDAAKIYEAWDHWDLEMTLLDNSMIYPKRWFSIAIFNYHQLPKAIIMVYNTPKSRKGSFFLIKGWDWNGLDDLHQII